MKTVLITGGSEGIGYELAKCFAKDGYEIFIAARDAEKMENAKRGLQSSFGVAVHTLIADLSVPGGAEKLFAEIEEKQIDVLVNNAGCGYTGESRMIPVEEDEKMIILNDVSPVTLTKLFLRQMSHRRRGNILNVSSTGAFQPGPYTASYYASKAFLLSYTKAVAEEAKEYGVCVQCLCPGPVATEFYRKSGQSGVPGYAMSARKCAEYAYSRLGKETVIIPGFLNRAVRLLPESLRMKFVQRTKKK